MVRLVSIKIVLYFEAELSQWFLERFSVKRSREIQIKNRMLQKYFCRFYFCVNALYRDCAELLVMKPNGETVVAVIEGTTFSIVGDKIDTLV